MHEVVTSIDIAAAPQTVWAILDDIDSYPEWNPIVPRLAGRTTLGQRLDGVLVIPELPTPPLTPEVNRVVGAREFRWISVIPGDDGFSAEHIFELRPTASGTHLVHRELFDGPGSKVLAPALDPLVAPAYRGFNEALKARAEAFAHSAVRIHPALDAADVDGARADTDATGMLRCACEADPVVVALVEPVQHNHLCGCSLCWKPEGALFAQVAVAPADTVSVVKGENHLHPVDTNASIIRHACRRCGVHMLGTVVDADHHFYGLTFVHPEREAGASPPIEFAGFVSSLVETGMPAALMAAVRRRLGEAGIPVYDAFSPEIMDVIAFHRVKLGRNHARS